MTLEQALIASLPLIVLTVPMLLLRQSGLRSIFAALSVSIIVALAAYRTPSDLLMYAVAKGIINALNIIYLLLGALLMFRIMESSGAMQEIAREIAGAVGKEGARFLVLGWGFSAFLESVAGFGTPIAVVTPMLVAQGCDPITAVSSSLIGHSWVVSYASFGTPTIVLQEIGNLQAWRLAYTTSVLLSISMVLCGLLMCHIRGGLKGIRENAVMVIFSSIGASIVFILSPLLYPYVAGVAAATTLILMLSLASKGGSGTDRLRLLRSVLPYVVLILASTLLRIDWLTGDVRRFTQIAISFPGTSNTGPSEIRIDLLAHPGTCMIIASFSAIILQRRSREDSYFMALRQTLGQSKGSILPLLLTFVMASIMQDSGMMATIALEASKAPAMLYIALTPLIGVIGCLSTGTNTGSNAIFGPLHENYALAARVDPYIILAAQNAGGAVGSAISPFKILLGCSAVNIKGKEGQVMSKTFAYCLILALMLSITAVLLYIL